jgi:hypothetical protein
MANPASGWVTLEIFQRNSDGEHTLTPFSSALAASGSIAIQAVTKMRMVQELGWPEAKQSLKDDEGRPRIVRKDDVIWMLKCKPSCWRLYFYVYKKTKQIVYLLAICKKAQAEDPADAAEARRLHDSIGQGRSAATPFVFPVG